MSTPRLPDWQERLSALITRRLHTPFQWGEHDCALWGAEAWAAVTGIDNGVPYRGTYSTARGALRRLRQVDGVNLPIEAVDKRWGDRHPVAVAKVGDLVAVDLEALGIQDPTSLSLGMSVGVCYGRSSLFVGVDVRQPGLISIPTLWMSHCYVGCS